MKSTLTKLLVMFFASVVYLTYSYFVLIPNKYQNFSLIDDGQTIINNSYFNQCFEGKGCNNLYNIIIEKEFGRFRPGYWVINYLKYELIGLNPILLHSVRVYLIGLIVTLLIGIILFKSKGSIIAVLISMIFFFTSFSFTENIVRLGPVEPYQVVFLALASYFYLFGNKQKWIFIIIFYLLSTLIKETSVVVLLPIILTSLYYKDKDWKKSGYILFFGVMFFIFSRYFARPIDSSVAYIENFKLDSGLIFKNVSQYFHLILNSTSPFIKILTFVYLSLILLQRNVKKLFNKNLVYWILMFILFTGILVPWKYVLERYILVSLFSLSIVFGIMITQIQKTIYEIYLKHSLSKFFQLIFNLVFILFLINMLFMKFPLDYAKSVNYRNWYSQFLRFENDQVTAIVNTRAEKVYIDAIDSIDNWEVLYEIPIHTKQIFNSEIQTVRVDSVPVNGFVFVRTPFLLGFKEEELVKNGFKLVEQSSYSVKQIDPLKFRENFSYRPLTTLINPPILDQEFKYDWKIFYKK